PSWAVAGSTDSVIAAAADTPTAAIRRLVPPRMEGLSDIASPRGIRSGTCGVEGEGDRDTGRLRGGTPRLNRRRPQGPARVRPLDDAAPGRPDPVALPVGGTGRSVGAADPPLLGCPADVAAEVPAPQFDAVEGPVGLRPRRREVRA